MKICWPGEYIFESMASVSLNPLPADDAPELALLTAVDVDVGVMYWMVVVVSVVEVVVPTLVTAVGVDTVVAVVAAVVVDVWLQPAAVTLSNRMTIKAFPILYFTPFFLC
jgi:hypothetical protein